MPTPFSFSPDVFQPMSKAESRTVLLTLVAKQIPFRRNANTGDILVDEERHGEIRVAVGDKLPARAQRRARKSSYYRNDKDEDEYARTYFKLTEGML